MLEFLPAPENDKTQSNHLKTRQHTLEAIGLILVIALFFGYTGYEMGVVNLFNTLFKTAHDLLLNTVLYLMGITVLAGALSHLLTEFHVVSLLERLLVPLMRPLYNLPGRAAMAAVMAFFSDNPAIISLAKDKRFSGTFKPLELISLTNFATAFGMGLIVITFMSTLPGPSGQNFLLASLIGLVGALIGSVVSTRLMQYLSSSVLKRTTMDACSSTDTQPIPTGHNSSAPVWLRGLNAIMDGGKTGVDMGLSIIPGVLIISTVVMVMTFGPSPDGYTGAAYEGIALLPKVAGHFSGFFHVLFGFEHPELVAYPITSMGAVGAAMSLVPNFMAQGMITESDIAVFTAIGMCWSGYLSTHTAVLDSLGYRQLTSSAILSHTVGGLCAGIAARYLYLLVQAFV